MSPGEHVVGTLDTTKIKAENPRQHLGQGGFANARNVLDEEMAFSQQVAERQPNLLFLAKYEPIRCGNDLFQ